MLATLLLAAAALHPVEPSTSGGTLFDGDRYVAWNHGAQVRVLDEQSGTAALFNAADGVGVERVGRVWLELLPDFGYHSAEDPAWVERATGRVIYDDPGDLTKHADLDDPALFVKLCDPLRRRRNPQFDELEGGTSRYIGPTLSGDAALDLRGEDTLILRRCGTRRTTVLTRTHTWLSASIGGGRAAWIDRGRLLLYDVATGARRSFAIPGARTRDVDVLATRAHVFVDKGAGGDNVRRYAVELPNRRGPGAPRAPA
jgi:hypothetical protein